MNNLGRKLQQFMANRYGIDELYKISLYIYMILFFINIFLNSKIISIIEWILFLTMIYRSFSKQINKRKIENDKYIKLKKKISKNYSNIKKYLKDEYHVYRKCHYCKTILKLPIPNKRGIKHSKCPTCKKRNTFLILKKVKIEIIKKQKK